MAKKPGPLGLLRDVKKNDAQKLQAIEELDLTPEKAALLATKSVDPLYLDLLERELKRFLALPLLVKNPDYPFVPPLLVDALWHQFILSTAKYRRFCDTVYGYYLDHTPETSRARSQAINAGERFAYTQSRMVEAFGPVPETIWLEKGRCMGECILLYPPPLNCSFPDNGLPFIYEEEFR